MAQPRNQKEQPFPDLLPAKYKIISLATIIIGPSLLIYLVLRCEKNQCILFQLPMVIPTHLGAYWSLLSLVLILTFTAVMFLVSSAYGLNPKSQEKAVPSGFVSLLCCTGLLALIAYVKPEYISIVYDEYLRLLVITTVLCIIISSILFVLTFFDIISDKENETCSILSFFYGNKKQVQIGHVELKYFFYVHVGLVAWGIIDTVIFLNALNEHRMTAPVSFLMISQYLIIAHTLLFEHFIPKKSFVTKEGLGFFWLLRVLMYLPFFNSLPLYYTATTGIVLSKPAILADCVFYLFGFVIYISSIHQRENFINDQKSCKQLKTLTALNGKKLLISGYWGIVQKPDYLGYIIIWTSWTVACGFSALSVIVLAITIGTVYIWLRKSCQLKKNLFGAAWGKYIAQVPYQIIPHIY